MKLQQVMSKVRQAIDDYNMIEDNDVIAIGISGGKDSLTLLHALNGLRKYYPKKFDIIAVTVDLGFHNVQFDEIQRLCDQLNISYHIIPTEISEIVFKTRNETNPCSLCAKMRKGALNNYVSSLGCNKVAYAHHKDDANETLIMSLIYEGQLHTFQPVTYLDRSKITVIRPMIYMNESDIIGFANKYNLPVLKSPCPVDGYTKREYVKNLIKTINNDTPGVKDRIFSAITSSNLEGWNFHEQ